MKIKKIMMPTEEEFNEIDRHKLYQVFVKLTKDNLALEEEVAILKARQFAKKSEKMQQRENASDQISLKEFDPELFNEIEAVADQAEEEAKAEETAEDDTVTIKEHKRAKRKGKREADLSKFDVVVIEHELSEEELAREFPDGYTILPPEVYRKLEVIPATFIANEHHIHVYKGKDGRIVKAPHPKEMLSNSIATPSLVAMILNAKYTNAVPLYRIEQEFERNDISISRQTMANWVITTAERHLSLVYDRIKEELVKSKVVHADETPLIVTKDGRTGTHQNYMWVYRSGNRGKAKQAVIYDYQRTRKADGPRDFLQGFGGYLVCDGYQVYHTLEKDKSLDFSVCGCWVHAMRRFKEVIKSLSKDDKRTKIASEAVRRIDAIYIADKSLSKLPPAKLKEARKKKVKPLVDSFFDWARKTEKEVFLSGKVRDGLTYCLNQEKYLRQFLTNPEIPLDNNLAEQAIRPFCIGKKNWVMIDTMHGADASAIIYSLVETAKANKLNIFYYIQHLLEEIPKHLDDTSLGFLEDLLPWSGKLPENCYKKSEDKQD